VRYKTDITGMTFGLWTVIGFDNESQKLPKWVCRCECGTTRSVWAADLKRGHSNNCGCVMTRSRREVMTSHSMSRHPAYRSWIEMRARCQNATKTGYDLYGGRGISVCAAWADSFEAFWADMGPGWEKGLSIDRIDVNGNYEPSNCRWANAKEQAENRRDKRLIDTPDGKMNVDQAATRFGLSVPLLRARIRYGWKDPHEMVKPARKTSRIY
jgi:hypothetical protein